MFNASNTVRVFLLDITIVTMIAIWLTGFDQVHWFSYVLPTFLLLAAVTGFCPGLFVSRKILAALGLKE